VLKITQFMMKSLPALAKMHFLSYSPRDINYILCPIELLRFRLVCKKLSLDGIPVEFHLLSIETFEQTSAVWLDFLKRSPVNIYLTGDRTESMGEPPQV
jgi:hypothetical protein